MIIAGTGHRPNKLGGYGVDARKKVVSVARYYLARQKAVYNDLVIISGMALGWDQALATAARMEEIPFIAYVPFKGQEASWPQSSQYDFNELLKEAQSVVYVSEPGYAPWKMQVRNEAMVKACDKVVALWDGTSGGTGNCVAYANKINKPIDNVWHIYD